MILEPVRSILIPGFDDIKRYSKEAGALGGGISGSGPSIFMFNKDESTAKQVEQIMQDVFNKLGLDFKTYVTTINYEGVRLV
jgi:homoserine kinase